MSSDQAVAAQPEISEVLLKALHRAEEPITAAKLREGLTGPYKVALETIENHLKELVSKERAFSFEPYKSKATRYWAFDLEHYARRLILETVTGHPKTWSEIKKALKSPLKGFPEARQSKLQKTMIDKGELHVLPAFVGARTSMFSNRPPDASHYIEDALRKIQKKLSKFDVSASDIKRCALALFRHGDEPEGSEQGEPPEPDTSLEERIIERMVETVPGAANGSLVPLRELRRSMGFQNVSKSAFDQAVLRLADQGKVALHRHDFPTGLSAEDRSELVANGTGDFYIGIALRQ